MQHSEDVFVIVVVEVTDYRMFFYKTFPKCYKIAKEELS